MSSTDRSPTAKSLYFDVNKPEYVALPETFLTSIAQDLYQLDYRELEQQPDQPKKGVIYRSKTKTAANFELLITDPFQEEASTEPAGFLSGLNEKGVRLPLGNAEQEKVARALSDSIVGVRAEKSTNRAAIPMTPALASLQNLRGLTKKQNPYNLPAAMQTFYRLGVLTDRTTQLDMETWKDASYRWNEAMKIRMASDGLLSALDSTVLSSLLKLEEMPEIKTKTFELPESDRFLNKTNPFLWFNESWNRLTSEPWVSAMPARRWSDWATAVLRLSMGFGYLWILRWNTVMAHAILRSDTESEDVTWEYLVREVDMNPLLKWESSSDPVGVRDIASEFKSACLRYTPIVDEVAKTVNELTDSDPNMQVSDFFKNASSNSTIRESLRTALNTEGGDGVYEFIRYALLCRQEGGRHADHYGLLKKRGQRYTVVEPGTELVALIASLTMDSPGGETSVKHVRQSFLKLGLQPTTSELIKVLDKSRLARGSADADDGVIVRSAY